MAGEGCVLSMPPRPWRRPESFRLEENTLVRIVGRRQMRWPLSHLREITLGVRRSPYTPPIRFARLRLGGHVQVIACGPKVQGYGAFVTALARAAPHAPIRTEGGRLAGLLIMSAALLGAGAGALALAAVMAGLAPLGLDLAARLSFLLILVFAVTPWIGRTAPLALDADALPEHLLNPL